MSLGKHYGVLVLDVDQLPAFIRKLILRVDAKAVTIEISPSSVAPFDIADLSAQINRNLVTLDRSLKQFYELLTNYDALIRFIEGKRRNPTDIIAALVLDCE
ncbi:hypothetical protein KIN20_013999 [Parelaphostrongylus tenuis]|uniref:Uncharacterized protein n=1 Tax=Parelaphostrongylus tenuis TaxID=148309 RepID=A0AAD5QP40_PARTN|nr:hypothetical protein KIN20_013999 [Parelaphostrongylus tenuis]